MHHKNDQNSDADRPVCRNTTEDAERRNDDQGQHKENEKGGSPNEVVDEDGNKAAADAGERHLDGPRAPGVFDAKLIIQLGSWEVGSFIGWDHGDYSLKSVARKAPPTLGSFGRAAGRG